ncbi:STAS domain-containing protein [uncultured Halopseudomonas sp.]|uniref:STAS domain-containing protein n=1 Tax=uncultured Halopseudomonas sp. TaxID=2901193 RepID=UPI0030EE2B97
MSASIASDSSGLIRIEGELDFTSAVSLRTDIVDAIKTQSGDVTLDFGKVTLTNSVGLSLILVAARALEGRAGSLRLQNVPAGLQSIARVCELEDWLATLTV